LLAFRWRIKRITKITTRREKSLMSFCRIKRKERRKEDIGKERTAKRNS